MSKDYSPSVGLKLHGRRLGGFATALVAALAVSACGETKPVGSVGHVKGFAGLVAADEPRAVVIARDVLSAGGTAADAAVSLYFTMAVTYPSTASLGGGGMCVVFDKDKKRVEALDFVAPPSTAPGEIPTAVPANARGFFALHAKYGKLRWESLLVEPERLARTGSPVSRALANDIAKAYEFLARDVDARRIFLNPDETPLREGEVLRQPELAATLANIRRNPGDLYTGPQGRELVAGVQVAGGTLAVQDLRDMRPRWVETLSVTAGNDTAHFAPPPAVGSTVAAQLVGALWGRYASAAADERPFLLSEGSGRAFADRPRWMLPHGWTNVQPAGLVAPKRLEDMMAGYNRDSHTPVPGAQKANDAQAGTGFTVLDSYGNAVACGLSTYGLFGSGRVAAGTGIVLSGSPGLNGPPAVAPMLAINVPTNTFRFAGTASGGVTAPSALAQVYLSASAGGMPLTEAVALPRVHDSGAPDIVFVESGNRAADPSPLTRRGRRVTAVEMPSRVNALSCPSGTVETATCQVAVDPRGSGLGLSVGKD